MGLLLPSNWVDQMASVDSNPERTKNVLCVILVTKAPCSWTKGHYEDFVMVVPNRDAWGFLLEHFCSLRHFLLPFLELYLEG